MKTMTKIAAGALVACGLAVAATAPADAGVRIGIGFGLPIVAAAVEPATCFDAYGQPYYCGYPGYYAPAVVGIGFGGHGDWHGGFRPWRLPRRSPLIDHGGRPERSGCPDRRPLFRLSGAGTIVESWGGKFSWNNRGVGALSGRGRRRAETNSLRRRHDHRAGRQHTEVQVLRQGRDHGEFHRPRRSIRHLSLRDQRIRQTVGTSTLVLDPASRGLLPYWKNRPGNGTIRILNEADFVRAVIPRAMIDGLRKKKTGSMTGHVSIVAEDYKAAVVCDAPDYSIRFVGIAGTTVAALNRAPAEFGCERAALLHRRDDLLEEHRVDFLAQRADRRDDDDGNAARHDRIFDRGRAAHVAEK